MSIIVVLEIIIGWLMKGKGLWSIYKDIKSWLKKKDEIQVSKKTANTLKYKKIERRRFRSVGNYRSYRNSKGRKVA